MLPVAKSADKRDEEDGRTAKMARFGRKYAALFELAVQGSETGSVLPEEYASRLLRLLSSASWADPSFLEELSESGLVRAMCQALPVLKANAASRTTAASVQDLADLEEGLRKLRHELALAEKRLPGHGSGGSVSYTTWASVGHICTLMLQALTYSTALCQGSGAANTRGSPSPGDNARVSPGTQGEPSSPPQPTGGDGPDGQPASSPGPSTTPAGASTIDGDPSGSSTPHGRSAGAPMKVPGNGVPVSPGVGIGGGGGNMPAVATEGALLKLLGNKHVMAHAKEVVRVVPEPYKTTLARILVTQISTEMKATHAGVVHILKILGGDPAATSPAPSALPKSWFNTATLLKAYCDPLRDNLCPPPHITDAKAAASAPATATDACGSAAVDSSAGCQSNGGPSSEISTSPGGGQTRVPGGGGDVEMADSQSAAQRSAAAAVAAGAEQSREPETNSSGMATAAEDSADRRTAEVSRAAVGSGQVALPPTADGTAAEDPRAALLQLLQDMASSLCEAVTSAHGVGRMALLLRGEAAMKFPNAAAYMPTALSINELMGHLDGLACVATALGTSDCIKSSVTSLLTSQAMKELLGAGKVYVTTVIAAGALTRDLAIDAIIPQSLRQGYMAAVLTPLETGALLNERRAPQVLAYRNSITESSYYQVMDAESLPYGVNVRFEDEQEAEGMGVVREWLSQIAADLFSPERGLFVRGAADKRAVHPAPHSRLQEDYLGYMRFAGRIVGLALRANVPLGVVLSTGLFNYMTDRRATLQDLQQIDPQVYTTCQNILSTHGAEALELYHVWHAAAGEGDSIEQELLPGGARLLVTDVNKAEYVQLLANHVVITTVEEQCAAFLAGVQDTAHHLPDDARLRRAFLAPLLLDDLNRITAGESTLDPDDWAAHTDVAGFDGTEELESLNMFWQLVSEYGPEDRQRLLQFWTAMTHLPSGGFKALNQRLQIMKLGPPARPAGAEALGDRTAGPTANGHGPSADGAGPHSHRLEGDSLEVEDQDQSDGMDEAAEEAEPNGDAGRGSGAEELAPTPGARTGGGGVRSPSMGHDAHPAEADLPGGQAGASGGAGPSGVTADAGSPAQSPSAVADGNGDAGEGADIPFGEDDEDIGADEDDMDYGDDEDAEDEEFQRQLEMALALSLQDMSAEPAPDGSSAGGAAGQTGAGDADEAAGTSGSGGAGSDAVGGDSPPQAGAHKDAAQPESATASDRPESAAVGDEQHAEGRGGAARGPTGGSAPESAASPSSPAQEAPGDDRAALSSPGESAADSVLAEGHAHACGGTADGGRGEDVEASADNGAGNATDDASGTAGSAPGDQGRDGASNGALATPTAPLSPAAGGSDLVDMDAGAGAPANEVSGAGEDADEDHDEAMPTGPAARSAEAAASAGVGAGEDSEEPRQGAEQQQQQQAQEQGEVQDGQRVGGTQEPEQPQQQQQVERQPERPVEGREELAPPQPPPHQQAQQVAAAALSVDITSAGAAADGAASTGPEAAAESASLWTGRAPPLLPQARTCFLQLNLPVYSSIEDMRRAFAIALDNMSFGLH